MVKKNRKTFFEYLRIDPERLAIPQQVHSSNINIINGPGVYQKTDSLITSSKGVVLTIQSADCFPIFIYEPVNHICSIVHSGWRGTAKNIVGNTIELMKNKMMSRAEDMLVAVGAGIQQKNYQVDSLTASHFSKEFLIPDGKDHYRLDILGNILNQILNTGVKKQNIECDTRCTFENGDLFYSYRRDGGNSGRMMGVICLL